MSERRAFKKLKDALITSSSRRLDRVENLVGNGWPDCNGCFDGTEFWIEIKEPTEPVRETTPLFGSNHKLEIDQRNWMNRQTATGGLCYIYIDTGKHRLLLSGKLADKINIMTMSELKRAALWCERVPMLRKNKWEGVANVIATRQI